MLKKEEENRKHQHYTCNYIIFILLVQIHVYFQDLMFVPYKQESVHAFLLCFLFRKPK
jgi:hypothetical protein